MEDPKEKHESASINGGVQSKFFLKRHFKKILYFCIVFIILYAAFFFVFKKNVFNVRVIAKYNLPHYNTTDRDTVRKINDLSTRTPASATEERREERKKDILEMYSLAWNMFNNKDIGSNGNLTGAAYMYFTYVQSGSSDLWFNQFMYSVDPKTFNTTRKSAPTAGDLSRDLLVGILLQANGKKEDKYPLVIAARLLTRDLTPVASSSSTSLNAKIPKDKLKSVTLAIDLLKKAETAPTQFRGIRFSTNMKREELRAKMSLAMVDKWDKGSLEKEYKDGIAFIGEKRKEILAAGDPRKEVAIADISEITLRISHIVYLWSLSKDKSVLPDEIKKELEVLYSDVYNNSPKIVFSGMSTISPEDSYVNSAFIEMAGKDSTLKAFLTNFGWKFATK